MIKEIIGLVAAGLAVIAYIPYLRDILSSKSKPHVYSWFIWGLTSILIFGLQITHHAGAGAYTTATAAVICFVVFFLSLKNGTKYITYSDSLFFILALIAAACWLFAKQPTLSMILLITTDVFGIVPSARKAWNKPYEETVSMWVLNGLRHALSISALQRYSVITMLNPVVWSISNLCFALMLILRRFHKP